MISSLFSFNWSDAAKGMSVNSKTAVEEVDKVAHNQHSSLPHISEMEEKVYFADNICGQFQYDEHITEAELYNV